MPTATRRRYEPAVPRLFIAIKPPGAIVATLLGAMGDIAGARWQRADQLHLTLAFLGNVAPATLGALDTALAGIDAPSIHLSCRGVAHFNDDGRPSAVWAAAQPAESLSTLAGKTRYAAQRAGAEPQGRAFVPHITLARLSRTSGDIGSFLESRASLATAPHVIEAFGLYESHLGPDGSTYRCLADYPLRPR